MTYRTVEDGITVAEERVSYSWWVLSEAGLRDELSAAGCTPNTWEPPEARVYLVRGPAGRWANPRPDVWERHLGRDDRTACGIAAPLAAYGVVTILVAANDVVLLGRSG
jgi:hypothetical protein